MSKMFQQREGVLRRLIHKMFIFNLAAHVIAFMLQLSAWLARLQAQAIVSEFSAQNSHSKVERFVCATRTLLFILN